MPSASATARRAALVSGQERQKNLLHALAAALRRVASDRAERDGVLDVLEKTRDGRRARVARTRLVLNLLGRDLGRAATASFTT